ncbi:MAG: 60 kDa chaperonin 1 [Chloroflexota bacterium]|nr:MAG: 60 kDa chaperonin 1 [Chloroflexota bacterium]
MRKRRTREVVFQPRTYRGFQQGINQIAAAIRPTLGPRPRIVAIQRILDQRMPEMLDNGGVIAQRIIQLPDRDEDVGAMFIRDMLWRLHDQVGDGTAAAAVLFQAIYNEGVRYLTAGGDARRLHEFLQKGLEVILDQLSGMTVSASGKEQLAQIAESICYDPALAKMMGEIFDIIGEYGRLEIRPGRGRELEREYVEGMYWERGLVSREMITDRSRSRTELENAAILISDLDIEQPQQLFPALEVALRAKIGALLIVANRLSDSAIGFLLANKKPEQFQVMAVQTPGFGKEEQAAALEDLAILTGGRPFIQVAGDTFEPIKVEHFGQARRVWADPRNFGVIGGKGDPRRLRQHIASLRAAYNSTEETVLQGKLLSRIGKLLGGSATLWIGGATELEINERQEMAERTAAAMRGAMMEGVVPGGGVALLACRPALQQRLAQATDSDERAAYQILLTALAVPLRTLVSNAGYDPGEVMAQINLAGPGYGFDVVAGRVVEMRQAGICDAAMVQKTAVYTAISSAALALTIDVLVHRNGQPEHAAVHTPGKRKRL